MRDSARETGDAARTAFDRRLGEIRPALHRYAARMTGSALDGEDVVQDALVHALAAFNGASPLENVDGWLFRITHNAAIDFLRGRSRRGAALPLDMAGAVTAVDDTASRIASRAALRAFMQLPPQPRSAVILKDVLGHSNDEIGAILGATLPAVKAALHRGRAQFKLLAEAGGERPLPTLDNDQLARLARYVDRFNAHDFDGVRAMLSEDVRFDLVTRARSVGRSAITSYFTNYRGIDDWHLRIGLVDGQLAVIMTDPRTGTSNPTNIIALDWAGDSVSRIRDFRYARYVLDGAEIVLLPQVGQRRLTGA
ncbi:sigma-70 family RNA polymerase sigma factor [Sphingomonas oligophenolica]|uniref:Sigma-70 family RNA polymerase sigma factor n=1 Tax=Sphingomonas oligophenolica TaxID=301154 RepID=A0ABU9Y8L5_9SPHN